MILVEKHPCCSAYILLLEGPFITRQANNSTDPLKNGTVRIIFVRIYPCCLGSKQHGYFLTKLLRTVPLFNGSVLGTDIPRTTRIFLQRNYRHQPLFIDSVPFSLPIVCLTFFLPSPSRLCEVPDVCVIEQRNAPSCYKMLLPCSQLIHVSHRDAMKRNRS